MMSRIEERAKCVNEVLESLRKAMCATFDSANSLFKIENSIETKNDFMRLHNFADEISSIKDRIESNHDEKILESIDIHKSTYSLNENVLLGTYFVRHDDFNITELEFVDYSVAKFYYDLIASLNEIYGFGWIQSFNEKYSLRLYVSPQLDKRIIFEGRKSKTINIEIRPSEKRIIVWNEHSRSQEENGIYAIEVSEYLLSHISKWTLLGADRNSFEIKKRAEIVSCNVAPYKTEILYSQQ